MPTLKNNLVISNWTKGKAAKSSNGALSTDGRDLFSYNLRIGYRSPAGVCIVADYTSPGGGFHSSTTSCHVGKARSVADHIMHPTVFENSEFKNDDY